MAYRATTHESTKCTPNKLMFGREVRLPIDIMYGDPPSKDEMPACPIEYVEWVRSAMQGSFELARDNLKKSAQRQKRYYDRNTELRSFKPGDWVWVFYPPDNKDKFGRGWSGPYLIIQKLGEVNYRIQKDPGARIVTLHVDHLETYVHDDTPEPWTVQRSHCEIGVQVDLLD